MKIFKNFKTQINMKTKILFLIALFLIINRTSFSQTPTYTLRVDSMRLVSINAPDDAIEFGVYLTHTNAAEVNFGLAGQQLFFSFNPGILPGCTVSDTDNCAEYRMIDSQLPVSYRPRSPSVSTATNPPATVMRLAINAFQGIPGLNITGATNLLIVRMRLRNMAPPTDATFNNECLGLAWRNPPVVAFSTKVFAYIADVNTDITTPQTHTIDSTGLPCPLSGTFTSIALNLTILSEGLYYPLFNLMSRRDTVRTYLRNITSPYSIIDSAKGVIDSVSFSNNFAYNNASAGTYYIVIKHFNSIETWSKNGGESFVLGDSTIYNFTTANSQAYGNNLKLKGGKYCIYSGDVNQDLWVDGKDLAQLDNHAYQFLSGRFLPSDLNGDNVVDGTDFLIGDNNWRYVHTISPLNLDLRSIEGYVQP